MKMRVAVPALLLLLSLSSITAYAVSQSAEEVVRNTSDRVLERLSTEKEILKIHPERIYDMVQELVVPHFDFPIMSRWVLGKIWREASQDQRQAFIEQFKTLLVRTYAKALLEYSDEEIKYLPSESDPNSNLVMIKTQIIGNGSANAIPINYRMHISGGEWKVIDIAVDGVSLVGTYRGSFASEIRKNGLNSLITKLSERNEKLLSAANQ